MNRDADHAAAEDHLAAYEALKVVFGQPIWPQLGELRGQNQSAIRHELPAGIGKQQHRIAAE